jgi:hypothetical protein
LLSDLKLKLPHSFVYCTPKNINFYINDLNVYFLNSLPLYQNWEVANGYLYYFLISSFKKLKFFGITSMFDVVNAKNIETAIKHH